MDLNLHVASIFWQKLYMKVTWIAGKKYKFVVYNNINEEVKQYVRNKNKIVYSILFIGW